MGNQEQPGRLLTLDAMRGLAAIVVMLGHCSRVLDRSGWLAVDFFFLLSGFVIARAYGQRLATGLPLLQFAKLRFARLYPMFALGLVIGFAVRFVAVSWEPLAPWPLAISMAFNALLLPTPASPKIFPINQPGWSLFFELAVNLLFAIFMVRARLSSLVAVAVAAALLLIATAGRYPGLGGVGPAWDTFFPGCARTLFSFTAGVIISRLHLKVARTSWLSLVAMAVLVALLLVSVSGVTRAAYDRLFVIIASPLLVWVGASFEPPKVLERLSAALGEISFPLYAVHLPIFLWFDHVAISYHTDSSLWRNAWKLAFFLSIVPISWLLAVKVDAPVRKWLASRIRANGAGRPATITPAPVPPRSAHGRSASLPPAPPGRRSRPTAGP